MKTHEKKPQTVLLFRIVFSFLFSLDAIEKEITVSISVRSEPSTYCSCEIAHWYSVWTRFKNIEFLVSISKVSPWNQKNTQNRLGKEQKNGKTNRRQSLRLILFRRSLSPKTYSVNAAKWQRKIERFIAYICIGSSLMAVDRSGRRLQTDLFFYILLGYPLSICDGEKEVKWFLHNLRWHQDIWHPLHRMHELENVRIVPYLKYANARAYV